MDSEIVDDTQNNATTPSQEFGSNLIAELLAIVSHGLGGISGAALMFMVVFMLETLLRSSSAKLYFVCGYIVVLVIFYATAVICFPPLDGTATAGTSDDDGGGGTVDDGSMEGMGGAESEEMYGGGGGDLAQSLRKWIKARGGGGVEMALAPFQTRTRASFYNFSVGYIFGYWVNLNINKKTSNQMMNNFYYLCIMFFCYVFSVFYVKSCSWEAGLVSQALGIISGMVWAQLVAPKITLDDGDTDTTDSSVGEKDSGSSTSAENGDRRGVVCDSNSSDMVCNAFRM